MVRVFFVLSFFALVAFPAAAQVSGVPYACPRDLRICPDGTSVTRTGPECVFAPCPGVSPGSEDGGVTESREPRPMLPPADPGDQVMCTMEAKICPDGTGVGRTGPNCEFAPCPGEEPDDGDEPRQDPPDDPEDEETDPY